jgi:hypothetical protein
MPSLTFILMISVLSRLLWSRKYKFGDFRYEVEYMFYIVIFEMVFFAFFHFALGINFDI